MKKIMYKGTTYKHSGFMGLNSYGESDNAAVLMGDCDAGIAATLRKGLALKDNEFNTSGPENVLLVGLAIFKGVSAGDLPKTKAIFAKAHKMLTADYAKMKAAKDMEGHASYIESVGTLLKRAAKYLKD